MLWGRFTSPQKIYAIIYFQLQSQVICFSQIVYCYLYCQTEIHDDVGTLAGSCFGQSYFLLCAERKRLVLITDKTFSLSVWVFELPLNCTAITSNSTPAGERPFQLNQLVKTAWNQRIHPGRIRKLYFNLVNVFDFVQGDSDFENIVKRSLFLIVVELLFYCRSSAISRQDSLSDSSRVAIHAEYLT